MRTSKGSSLISLNCFFVLNQKFADISFGTVASVAEHYLRG